MHATGSVTDQEFLLFREFLYQNVGIALSEEKKTLVTSRLNKRLLHYKLNSFGEYFSLVETDKSRKEKQILIDLLTTNETFFFREQKHFDFLANISQQASFVDEFSVWSAASSSGEEAYSIAMTLADARHNWRVMGSDISTNVIQKAKQGLYPMARIEGVPQDYLKKYCLKGVNEYEGYLLVEKKIRNRVNFFQHNLLHAAANIGLFNVIFLRNVLIYFDSKTKGRVVSHLVKKLKPNGYFIIGHSDKFEVGDMKIKSLSPSIYQAY